MQDVVSVLRDRGFVQMAAGVPVKFKSSVARGMHLACRHPELEQIKAPGGPAARPRQDGICR
jgi:hypothetical protein